MLIKLHQPLLSRFSLRVHTINLHTMTAASHMETPVPAVSDFHGLCVETVVPAAYDKFGPAFMITRYLTFEGAPCELVLGRKILNGYGIPYVTAIRGDLDAFGPAASARICPAW